MQIQDFKSAAQKRAGGYFIFIFLGAILLYGNAAPCQEEKKERNSFNEEALQHLSRALVFENQGNYAEAILEYQDAIALDSTGAVFYKEMAKNYLRLRKNSNAVDAFEKYLTMEPRDVEVHHILAEIYKQIRDFSNAERILERMRWIQTWPINFYYDLLQIYLINDKDKKAGELSRELLRLFPGEESGEDLTVNVKNIYQMTGHIPDGVSLFEGLTSEDPENPLYRFGLGDLYMAMGDSVRGSANLEAAAARDPELRPVQEKLTEIFLSRGEPDKALTRFARVGLELQLRIAHTYFIQDADSIAAPLFQSIMVDYPENFTPCFYLGIISFQNAKWDDAEKYLTHAIGLDSTQGPAFFYSGWTFLQKDEPAKARNHFAKAVALDPKNKDFLYFLSVSYYQLKEYENAASNIQKVLSINPGDVPGMSLYSDVLYGQGKFDAAEEMYLRVLELDSTNVSVMNNYSYMLAEQGIHLGKALELSRKAVEERPDNQSYLDTLGWIYYRLGRYQEALQYLLKAVEADSTQSSIIYDHIGDTYYKMGDETRARDYWRKALELDGENDAVRKKIEAGVNQ